MQPVLKQPAETLRRPVAFGAGDVVAELVSVAAVARGLVAGAAPLGAAGEVVDGRLDVVLTGGADGERYLVTAVALLAGGDTREAELEVAVVDGAWAVPDGGTPYLLITDFVARVGFSEVLAATDAAGDGRIDRAMVEAALSGAQALADAHLAARHRLPLDPAPELVRQIVSDLARARLYPRGAPEGVAALAKAAERQLERIADGRLPLGPAAAAAPPAPSAAPILHRPGRKAYPDGLAGY